jgi:hypothetical protein
MLIVGAMAAVCCAEGNGAERPWLVQLLARRKTKVATVALASKNARMIWANCQRLHAPHQQVDTWPQQPAMRNE